MGPSASPERQPIARTETGPACGSRIAGLGCPRAPTVRTVGDDRAVFVPFGGDEHDWAAAELGAWIARTQNAPLWLVGSAGREEEGQRDASRLIGNVSLILQRVAKVVARPLLIAPGAASLVNAPGGAGLVAPSLPDDWRHRGPGSVRAAVATGAEPPVLLVGSGTRPGALAPNDACTRFGWTLGGSRA